MNCANHPDAAVVAYCRACGKPLCSACVRDVQGTVYCDEHVPAQAAGAVPPPVSSAVPPPGSAAVPPLAEPPPGTPRPGVAFVLGWIPGVGAMYNGEFAKGFLHVLIFATLIWMTDHINGIFGLAIAAFVIYMPIEAYKTARARQLGLPAPDPLGLNNVFSGTNVWRDAFAPGAGNQVNPGAAMGSPDPLLAPERHSRVPIGALILIGLGVLFLLDEFGALNFDWIWRFWPLILIALGVRILMQRQRRGW